MNEQKTLIYAILILAIIALAGVGYNSTKLSDISKKLEKANEKLASVEKNQNTTITSLEKRIKQLESTIKELNQTLNNLKSKEETQYQKTASNLEKLYKDLEGLKQQLTHNTGNITEIQEKINNLEKRIEELSTLLLFPVTITDATGKPVTISKQPERIVSLFPSVTEILWAINASSQVIAVDSFSNYPPIVVELVKNGTLIDIGSGWFPSVEKILSVNPDLVIGVESVSSNLQLKSVLAKYGIPMIVLPDANFQDILDSIIIVGKATGHPLEASKLASMMQNKAYKIRNFINQWINQTHTNRTRVAIVVWVNPLWVAGNGTFQNDIILLAGGENALSNVTGWASISPEALLQANPDVIVITGGPSINMTRQEFINTLKQQLGDSVYNITAVKTGRIYIITGDYNDIMVRPGPRVVKAALLLSIILYPNAYGYDPDTIPEKITPETFQIPQSLP